MFLSLPYVLTFPAIVFVHYMLPARYKKATLLLISYVICAWMMPMAVLVLIGVTVISYIGGKRIEEIGQDKIRNRLSIVVVLLLVSVLVVLKYTNWLFGWKYSFIAPIGISYYTLEAIGYIEDVRKRKTKAELNFINYGLYLSFFPKLISGPVESTDGLLKQMQGVNEPIDYTQLRNGTITLCWGYFEKIVIANHAVSYVDAVFDNITVYSGTALLKGAVLYAFQLYADFDGYTNIAIGCALMLGYRLKHNFAQPYFSTSVKMFWRRWHISLSTWLKQYVYIPLGGSRKGKLRKNLNVIITFIVSGLWHGAGIKYLIWGGMHGLYQVAEGVFEDGNGRNNRLKTSACITVVRMIITFILVDLAWIVFRANSSRDAVQYIVHMIIDFRVSDIFKDDVMSILGESTTITMLLGMSVMGIVDYIHERKQCSIINLLGRQQCVIRWIVYILFVFIIGIGAIQLTGKDASSFIYGAF